MDVPELPEVETVRRTLTGLVKGKTIKSVEIRWPNIIKRPAEPEEFARKLAGETIQSIGRRGKFLLFHLDHYVMVSHLRMEGKYGLHQAEEPDDKHVHVIFTMTDGTQLRYRDVRKFGTMHLFKPGEEAGELPLSQLGPEPDAEEFTSAYLKDRLAKTNRAVKTALLDQKTVVGLGNIYVDEALSERVSIPRQKQINYQIKQSKPFTLKSKTLCRRRLMRAEAQSVHISTPKGKSECSSCSILCTEKRRAMQKLRNDDFENCRWRKRHAFLRKVPDKKVA